MFASVRLSKHDAIALEFVTAIAPDGLRGRVACAPNDESKQIAHRIEPKRPPRGRIAHYRPANNPRFQHSIQQRKAEKRHSDPNMAKKRSRNEAENAIRHRENQAFAKMSLRPRIARGFRPSQLVVPHSAKCGLAHDVIDYVTGEHHAIPRLFN